MKNYESEFRRFLLEDEAIAAVIGDRMFPLVLPQGVPLPAVTWRKDGKDRSPRHHGNVAESFLDLEVFTEAPAGYELGQDLIELIRLRADQFKGVLPNDIIVDGITLLDEFDDHIAPSDGKGEGTFVFTLEFSIWVQEQASTNTPCQFLV